MSILPLRFNGQTNIGSIESFIGALIYDFVSSYSSPVHIERNDVWMTYGASIAITDTGSRGLGLGLIQNSSPQVIDSWLKTLTLQCLDVLVTFMLYVMIH